MNFGPTKVYFLSFKCFKFNLFKKIKIESPSGPILKSAAHFANAVFVCWFLFLGFFFNLLLLGFWFCWTDTHRVTQTYSPVRADI